LNTANPDLFNAVDNNHILKNRLSPFVLMSVFLLIFTSLRQRL